MLIYLQNVIFCIDKLQKKKKNICITFQFVLPIVFQAVNVLFGLKTKNQKKYSRPVNMSYTVITFAANYEVCRL